MAEWILVNGARLEKSFFEANLVEARGCDWQPCVRRPEKPHKHCVVCGIASDESAGVGWCSDTRWLCQSCHREFIDSGK